MNQTHESRRFSLATNNFKSSFLSYDFRHLSGGVRKGIAVHSGS